VVVGSITAPGQILALPGASESTVVMVEPTRVLDTRYNIGLTGQVVANTSRKLVVTGVINTYIEATTTIIAKQVVPAGATGVLFNVTAVSPTAAGFLSIRPGTATGVPATAGLNFNPGDVVPNAVTVALPIVGANAGKINIYYGTATVGATLHVVADVVGYTTNTGLVDLTNRLVALETSGVEGPKGDTGLTGAKGDTGLTGPAMVALTFQSTVTAVFGFGGGLPAGITNGDTVRFGTDMPVGDAASIANIGCQILPGTIGSHEAAWSFGPVPYVLSYSNGYKQFGEITRIEICDGGTSSSGVTNSDEITFYNGSNDIYQALDFEGGWVAGPIPAELNLATLDVAQAGLFDLTFYWGDWANWGTYHYDYGTPQVDTIVTRSP